MPLNLKLFITGTDTEVGKTHVSTGLLRAGNRLGLSTLGIKPIASGCLRNAPQQLYSEDTLALMQAASVKLEHEHLTPYAFEPPIAPHIAAQLAQQTISLADLKQKIQYALTLPTDISVIEGCGGWYVPLNENETMADFVVEEEMKIILVVGLKLGCINHSILTCQAIQQHHGKLIGWIGNHIDPAMAHTHENIQTLMQWLPVPCLGIVAHGQTPEDNIDVQHIMRLSLLDEIPLNI